MLAETRAVESREWISLTSLFALASFAEIFLFSNLAAFTPVYLLHLGFHEASILFWTGILASVGMLLGFWFVPMWRHAITLNVYPAEGVIACRGRVSGPAWAQTFDRACVRGGTCGVCDDRACAKYLGVYFGSDVDEVGVGKYGLMFASISERAPRQRVGLAIALITGSQPLGGVIGSLVGGFIVSTFGIIALWWFDAAIIAFVFMLLVLFYHEPFVKKVTLPLFEMLRGAVRAVVTTPIVVKYFIFSFIATSGFFFTYPYLSTRIIEIAQGADVGATIGLVFGIAGIGTLIATPLWGALADKVGHARLLPLVTLLTACAYIPLYFASNLTQFTLFYFALAAFSPAINGLTFATIGLHTPPERRNAVMSMLYMPLNAAIVIAPTLASVLTGEVRQVFLFSAALVFGAFGMLVVTRSGASKHE